MMLSRKLTVIVRIFEMAYLLEADSCITPLGNKARLSIEAMLTLTKNMKCEPCEESIVCLV